MRDAAAPAGKLIDPRVGPILDAVIQVFESGGYDAVNLREIARSARVSLETIYTLFGSRDALRIAAMQRWLQHNVYDTFPALDPNGSTADLTMTVLRHMIAPYNDNPTMLRTYARARMSPGGDELQVLGELATQGVSESIHPNPDPATLRLEQAIYHILFSLTIHCGEGKLPPEEMLPILDTAVRKLLS